MDLTKELTIHDFEGGAVIERLEYELNEVIADCCDINKVADSVREINLKMKIKPDDNRIVLDIGFETSCKLGRRHPVISKAFLNESDKTASEFTAKEGDLFDGHGQPNISIIGGHKKEEGRH